MTHPHRQLFDREIAQITDNILRLGSLVDTAIDRSIEALKNRDTALARQIVADDAKVNDLRFAIEEECLTVIATQQPMASDLRVVIAAMNIVNDIERIGDHATGIAKAVIRMGDQPLLKPLVDVPRMANTARAMLKHSLSAYINRDPEMARAIAAQDDDIDHLYKAIFDDLLAIMAQDPNTISRGTYLLWCAHNLERIGDRVTNIAERVIFMTTGTMKELNV
jgi:phosphate transport system protein